MSYRQNIVASFAAKLLPNSLRCSANPETPSATAPLLFILTSSQSCGSSSCWIASSSQEFNVELKFFRTNSPFKNNKNDNSKQSEPVALRNKDQTHFSTVYPLVISVSGETTQCFKFSDGHVRISTVALWQRVHPEVRRHDNESSKEDTNGQHLGPDFRALNHKTSLA